MMSVLSCVVDLSHHLRVYALGPSLQRPNRSFSASREEACHTQHIASLVALTFSLYNLQEGRKLDVGLRKINSVVWKHFGFTESDLEQTTIKCKTLQNVASLSL